MSDKKYYGGALFPNRNKTNERAPDLSGDLELSMDQLKILVALAKRNEPLKLRMAAWSKEGRSGRFYSVTLSENKQQGDSRPAPKKRDDFDDSDIPF